MNVFKYVLIGVLTIFIAYMTACLVSPDRVAAKRTIVIQQPDSVVFNKIASMDTWPEWHPLFKQLDEKSMEVTIEPDIIGSQIKWDAPELKGGIIRISEIDLNQRIKTTILYEKDEYKKENYAEFLLESNDGSCKLTWVLVGSTYPFLLKPVTLMLSEVVKKNQDFGLRNFKRNLEESKISD